MKCESTDHDALASAKTKFYSRRGVRGDFSSFPQVQQSESTLKASMAETDKKVILNSTKEEKEKRLGNIKHSKKPELKQRSTNLHSSATAANLPNKKSTRRRTGISQTTADTITATQSIVQKLGWSLERVKEFIAEKFQGRRRAELSDDEALTLLYYLQAQHLESVP